MLRELAAKCLYMGHLGSLAALWVNLWQGYLGPGAEVPLTHPKRICLAVHSCTKLIVAPTHAKKTLSYHAAEIQNTECVSAAPKGEVVLVCAAHKVRP